MRTRKQTLRSWSGVAGWCFLAVLLAAIGALFVIPNYVSPPGGGGSGGCVNACINILRQIDGAKEQYYLENLEAGNDPAISRLFGPGNYIKTEPRCPAGGQYTIGSRDTPPACSISTHALR